MSEAKKKFVERREWDYKLAYQVVLLHSPGSTAFTANPAALSQAKRFLAEKERLMLNGTFLRWTHQRLDDLRQEVEDELG